MKGLNRFQKFTHTYMIISLSAKMQYIFNRKEKLFKINGAGSMEYLYGKRKIIMDFYLTPNSKFNSKIKFRPKYKSYNYETYKKSKWPWIRLKFLLGQKEQKLCQEKRNKFIKIKNIGSSKALLKKKEKPQIGTIKVHLTRTCAKYAKIFATEK